MVVVSKKVFCLIAWAAVSLLAACTNLDTLPTSATVPPAPNPTSGCEGRSILGVIVGCGTIDQAPPALARAAEESASDYIIGPGDKLDIFVWHNADLSREMPVRPDGRISMPLLGDTLVVGKTPPQLAAEIQDKLRTFVRDPVVTVIPTQFVGTFTRQIRVIGEAAKPQSIPYRSSMTVLDVMIEVGGLTRYADGDRAVLVRQVKGEQKSYRVRLDSLVHDGDINQNVDVEPGDILIIPQRYF
jgi:polysaccharide export outer membrane protein